MTHAASPPLPSPQRPSKRSASNLPTDSYSDSTDPLSPTSAEALAQAYDPKIRSIDAAVAKRLPACLAEKTEVIDAAIARQVHVYIDQKVDTFNAALARQLSLYLNDKADIVNAAIVNQLPAYLDTALPSYLETLLPALSADAPNTASPASPVSTSSSQISELPQLTPLARMFLPHLRTHLLEQFQQRQSALLAQCETLLDRVVYDACARVTAETADDLEDHRTDMELIKQDALRDFHDETELLAEEWKMKREDQDEVLAEAMQDEVDELLQKVERLRRTGLKRMVAREVGSWKRRRKGVPRGVGERVRGHKKLLGRRSEVEEAEWVDC